MQALFVGYFTLNYGFSSKHKIFFTSLSLIPTLYFIHVKFKLNRFLLVAPLFLYYLLVIKSWGILLNPVLPSLITSLLVLLKNKYYSIILIICSYIISFHLYPNEELRSMTRNIEAHSIDDYSFIDEEELIFEKIKCLIIETWGKNCGQCFLAMEALESFFIDLESEYKFQHEYLYIGKLLENERELFLTKEYIKFSPQLFQDKSKSYYDDTAMQGYPYFNFYKNDHKYLNSLAGFQHRFTDNYKSYINTFVRCNCEKRKSNRG